MASLFGLGGSPKGAPKPEAEAGLYKSTIATPSGGKALLIIDPQEDFHPGGSLGVAGARNDALKIVKMIGEGPDDIFVTLDTHNKYHIAHASFWKDKRGSHPAPFTTILSTEVQSQKWMASRKEHRAWAETYVAELEKNSNFNLVIWPDHCLIGTKGHNVYNSIMTALQKWETSHNRAVHYIIKGNNALTEHYSALAAEVPVPGYPETELNTTLLEQLKKFDKLLVCGQAKSHCVNFTVRDLVKNWDKKDLHKICVVKDASSSVSGFEDKGEEFLADMKKTGVNVIATSVAIKQHLESAQNPTPVVAVK